MPKFKFLLLTLIVFFWQFTTTVAAQENTSNGNAVRDFYYNFDNYKQAIDITQGSLNLESWGLKTETNIVAGTDCMINGRCFPNQEGGAISMVSHLTASLVSSPVTLNSYYAYLQTKNPLVKTAYATTGTQALTPILSLWVVSRNVAYLFFVVIFVVAGFMIMFRSKLNPQTSVSIQLALPKIVVSLILVTFSYAFIALIIDISNLTIAIIANLYKGFLQSPSSLTSDWLPTIMGLKEIATNPDGTKQYENIFSLMSSVGEDSRNAIGVSIGNLINDVGGGLWDLLDKLGASGSLASLILSMAVLGALFKTFFALLTSYVSIIISAIFSPFAFLFSAFPTSQSSPFNLLKSVLANALVFPATMGLLFLAVIIQGKGGGSWGIDPTKSPQFTDPNVWLPFGLSGLQTTSIGDLVPSLIAFGIVLAIPRVPDIIKEALQAKEGGAMAAAGEGLKGAVANIPLIGGLMR